jgi:hypothetical protein
LKPSSGGSQFQVSGVNTSRTLKFCLGEETISLISPRSLAQGIKHCRTGKSGWRGSLKKGRRKEADSWAGFELNAAPLRRELSLERRGAEAFPKTNDGDECSEQIVSGRHGQDGVVPSLYLGS